MRNSSPGGVGVQRPWSGLLKLADHGGWYGASADRAADRTRGRRRVQVVLPPQDSALSSAGAINSPGTGPVGDSGFGFWRPVEVDVVVAKRTSGRLELSPLGEVELQVDGHLAIQE